MTEVTTEMPRSRSIFIQSERVLRRSPLALTWPARLIAPPNSYSFSVSVVLPASGCEMMAKVRRRATSSDNGERSVDSVGTAMSDMAAAFGREKPADQAGIKLDLAIAEPAGKPHIARSKDDLFAQSQHPRGRPCLIWRGRDGLVCPVS